MNDARVIDLARLINSVDSPKAVLYVTGGGTEVFPMLLARGGGSATLLAGRILYARDDFKAALGCDPGRFVDARAARGLAMAAFRHALAVRGELGHDRVIGVGATSKLKADAEERAGRAHEIHVAVQSYRDTQCWSIVLPPGQDRAWEERINALLLLNILAARKVGEVQLPLEVDGCGISHEAIEIRSVSGERGMADVLVGLRPWFALDLTSESTLPSSVQWSSDDQSLPLLLLPGTFRPLHQGHVAMAEAASRLSGRVCSYEMSLFHPEKPPLDFLAIRSRLEGFEGRPARIYLTDAPTFVEKARLFPGCTFVVGHDTALRIVDPRFYGSVSARDAMLDELERLGTRFLVFGRVGPSGEFRDFAVEEFEHPVAGFLARVATPVPGHAFRMDVSSTEVRQGSDREYD